MVKTKDSIDKKTDQSHLHDKKKAVDQITDKGKPKELEQDLPLEKAKSDESTQNESAKSDPSKSIFRKESMEGIGSSQELRAYLRRSDRGLFLGIISLVLFIGGFWAWAVFSQIDTHIDALATVQDGNAYLYFTPDQAQAIQPGMSIFFKNTRATSVVDSVDTTIRQGVWPDVDQNGIPDFDWNSPYCEGFARALLPNGSYSVTIVVHSGSPIDFLFG